MPRIKELRRPSQRIRVGSLVELNGDYSTLDAR